MHFFPPDLFRGVLKGMTGPQPIRRCVCGGVHLPGRGPGCSRWHPEGWVMGDVTVGSGGETGDSGPQQQRLDEKQNVLSLKKKNVLSLKGPGTNQRDCTERSWGGGDGVGIRGTCFPPAQLRA